MKLHHHFTPTLNQKKNKTILTKNFRLYRSNFRSFSSCLFFILFKPLLFCSLIDLRGVVVPDPCEATERGQYGSVASSQPVSVQ